ncbi:MAG: FAD/FMN-containing dehydrogenase [Acidimicrobiales bacterium]|jgi:FAD/FMN-containing dehydrogenase
MSVWSNWSGRQTANPSRVISPASEAEFVAGIEQARNDGVPLRAVGAVHSHSRVAATDGVLVETDNWRGLVAADVEQKRAVLRSGTRVFQAGPLLFRQGMALHNQGDIDRQSIGGAIGTGTHGTGPRLQNFSAAVRGLRVVLATGDIVDCSPHSEPDLFEVARHSLGGVGIVTTVDLAVRDAYKLRETQWFEHPDDVFGRIDQLIADSRHFEFFWDPKRDSCVCKSLAETDQPSEEGGSLATEVLSDNQRVGWSHEIISSERNNLHTEMEYSVPAEFGPACFAELRALIHERFPDLAWPLEYRTLASDDLWISTASGRETVTISAHEDIALDDRVLFEACEEVFRRYGGRPHWGKVHFQTGSELALAHPNLERWWQTRDRYDPDELFVTPELAALRP